MLTFNVTFQCKPGTRDELLKGIKAAGIDASARAEAGNLGYDFYLPVDSADDLFLIEKYTDDEAVKTHVTQPHTAKLTELNKQYVTAVVMEKFEGGEFMKF